VQVAVFITYRTCSPQVFVRLWPPQSGRLAAMPTVTHILFSYFFSSPYLGWCPSRYRIPRADALYETWTGIAPCFLLNDLPPIERTSKQSGPKSCLVFQQTLCFPPISRFFPCRRSPSVPFAEILSQLLAKYTIPFRSFLVDPSLIAKRFSS